MPQKASDLIRQRFASAPYDWLVSAEGRRLRAKSLRHVRNTEGREAARRLRDDIVVFLIVPMP